VDGSPRPCHQPFDLGVGITFGDPGNFNQAWLTAPDGQVYSYDSNAIDSTDIQAYVGGPMAGRPITPSATRGSLVQGHLYIDTVDGFTGAGDELIDLPYTYTVG
jgi:hypothetical protein